MITIYGGKTRQQALRFPRVAGFPGGLLLVLFLCSLASCSRDEPKISRGVMSLVYYGGQEIREAYSFFVLPGDADGFEDLDTLFLYHDREELVWKLSSEDWISETVDGEVWIGSRGISMSDGPLPGGQFRAVLTDKGGSRGEKILVFDGPEKSRYPFPALIIQGGRYSIDSAYPRNAILWYDENGAYLGSRNVNAPAGTLAELEAPGAGRSAALWAEDPEHYTSALTAVVPLNN